VRDIRGGNVEGTGGLNHLVAELEAVGEFFAGQNKQKMIAPKFGFPTPDFSDSSGLYRFAPSIGNKISTAGVCY